MSLLKMMINNQDLEYIVVDIDCDKDKIKSFIEQGKTPVAVAPNIHGDDANYIARIDDDGYVVWCQIQEEALEYEIRSLRAQNTYLFNQLQQKENIIKEVREYVEKNIIWDSYQPHRKVLIIPNEVLEILDKEDK